LVIYSDLGDDLHIQAKSLQLNKFKLSAQTKDKTGQGIFLTAEQILLDTGQMYVNTGSVVDDV
jgi:hypothetical protein